MGDVKDHIAEIQVDGLARVRLAAGRSEPFCVVEWRSLHPETQSQPIEATERTFGVRAETLSRETANYGVPDTGSKLKKARLPEMMRVTARPRYFPFDDPDGRRGQNKLHFWGPGRARGVTARFAEAEAFADVVAVPLPQWDGQQKFVVDLAPLRLEDGILPGQLLRSFSRSFFRRLSYSRGAIFRAFRLNLADSGSKRKEVWKIAVTPQGIEFDAETEDPTRAGSHPSETLYARFRLEYDGSREKGVYFVRLIGVAEDDAKRSRDDVDRVSRRMAAMLDQGARDQGPAVFRFDQRGSIPALHWPLRFNRGLKVVDSDLGDPLIQIDPEAIDLRLATKSRHRSAATGLARVHGNSFEWHRGDDVIALKINAGTRDGTAKAMQYTRKADGQFELDFSKLAVDPAEEVEAPLDPLIDRLGPVYVQSGALREGAPPPYAFFALQEGWLQWPLPVGSPEVKDGHHATEAEVAMTGRIVAIADESERGLVVDDASGVDVALTWQNDTEARLTKVEVSVYGGAGRYLGFLFAAETGPTAAEALPGWMGGDASVREVPLWFGRLPNGHSLPAKLTWSAGSGEWHIDLKPADAPSGDDKPVLSWSPPDRYPFIANFPLTRAAAAAPEPSLTRGLIPRLHTRNDSGRFRLDYQAKKPMYEDRTSSKSVANELPTIRGFKGEETTGALFDWVEPDPGAPQEQSLLLPTLMGVTFQPADAAFTYTAHLRYDLPALDELFAWSDPPPSDPKDPSSATPDQAEPDTAVPAVTALNPAALVKIWSENRLRMRLTWTQDAAVAKSVPVNGGNVSVPFEGLAAPWVYTANTSVALTPGNLFGALSIANQPKGLAGAAVGIGGRVDPETDRPLALKIGSDEESLEPSSPEEAQLHVTGNAADMFELDDHRMDSRGTAFAPNPVKRIDTVLLRSVDQRLRKGKKLVRSPLTLMTTEHAISLTGLKLPYRPRANGSDTFDSPLHLFLRDLPLRKVGAAMRFDGVEGARAGGGSHPIEGARGAFGQSFDAANFADGLYEWRFYADSTDSHVGHFSIPFGGFAFRPLRLGHVSCDMDGQPLEFSVLGSVTLHPGDSADAGTDEFAFGADDVYGRNDLFLWTFERPSANADWSLTPTAMQLSDPTDKAVKLANRGSHKITIYRRLGLGDGGLFTGIDPVDAIDAKIVLDLETGKVDLTATLFGTYSTVSGDACCGEDGRMLLTFDLSELSTDGALVGLERAKLEIYLTATGKALASIQGALVIRGRRSGPALFRLSDQNLEWLDLTVGAKEHQLVVKVDHKRGALWLGRRVAGSIEIADPVTPLFHFELAGTATLDVAIAASFDSGAAVKPLDIAAAFALISIQGEAEVERRIRHEVELASETGDDVNLLLIDWREDEAECPIHWPIDGLALEEPGPSLAEISAGSLTFEDNQSRVLRIAGNAVTARHKTTPIWRNQRVAAQDLVRVKGKLRPEGPLSFLLGVKHVLSQGDTEIASWLGLDHVRLTTPAWICHEADTLSFVPRHSRRCRKSTGSAPLAYRGADIRRPGAEGVARGQDANLAGVHDAAAVEFLWAEHADGLVTIGNAPLRLPLPFGESGHILTLPWLRGVAVDALQRPRDGMPDWRLPTADIWAAHALGDTDERPMLGLNDGMSGPDLVARSMGHSRGPDAVIPVEQALFEPLDGEGEAVAIDVAWFKSAPLFPRAMLALAAHVRDLGERSWEVQSLVLHGGEGTTAPAVVAPILRRAVMAPRQLTTATDPAHGAEGTLVLVSARAVARRPAGRPINAADDQSLAVEQTDLAELRELAERAMPDALIVLRVAETMSGRPKIVIQSVQRGAEPLDRDGAVLTAPQNDVVTSPALGWPMPPTGSEIAGGLGPEFALQVPSAGFAGRSGQTLWPATAHATDKVLAHYSSFAHHVIFDRGAEPFVFDGPFSRHLATNAPRRRAPLDAIAGLALGGTGAAPISAPVIERTLIGTRPGVITATSAAAKITSPDSGAPLDKGWRQLGRAADTGPVLAHQLRAPRSPILPADPSHKELALRRRTFLSRADMDENLVLTHFEAFDGAADVMRIAEDGDVYWRIAAMPDSPALPEPRLQIGPSWNGAMSVGLSAVTTGGGSATLADLLRVDPDQAGKAIVARLQIGSVVALAAPKGIVWRPDGNAQTGAKIALQFDLSGPLGGAVATATAATPMLLSLGFPNAQVPAEGNSDKTQIDFAPVREVILPVLRDPEGRRVVSTRSSTVAFGDPAYDRSLASPALDDTKRNPHGLVRLSADRREYNADSMIYFAAGQIDESTGEFAVDGVGSNNFDDEVTLKFERLAMQPLGSSAIPVPEQLMLRRPDGVLSEPTVNTAQAVGFRLSELQDSRGQSPLAPGDTLIMTAKFKTLLPDDSLRILVRIVAAPVIAPPAAIYSVLESRRSDGGGPVSRSRLHAPAALPTRIEFPDLVGDLARGHVRREALFVWRYAVPRRRALDGEEAAVLDLVKIDRSGGFQPPK